MNSIYILIDPRDMTIRYLGITCQLVQARFRGHINIAKRGDRTHRSCWIRQLLLTGIEPLCWVIEITNDREREKLWISRLRDHGCDLTNKTDGGDGVLGLVHTVESKAMMRNAHLGKVISLEHRLNIGKAVHGRKLSLVHRQRIGEANRGRVFSEEIKKKFSLAHIGVKLSEDHRQACIRGRKGLVPTPEHRQKLKEAGLKWWSENTRVGPNKGRVFDAAKRRFVSND